MDRDIPPTMEAVVVGSEDGYYRKGARSDLDSLSVACMRTGGH